MVEISIFFEQDGVKYSIDKLQEIVKDRITQLVVSRIQEKLVQKIKEQLSDSNIKVELTIVLSKEKIKAVISGNKETIDALRKE